ncbi:MAG: hypothetical protein JSW58_00280, partial [Candidatus Latescibacterota bacterium]
MPRSSHSPSLPQHGNPGELLDDAVLSGLVGRLGSDTLRYLPAVLVPALASVLHISIFTRMFPPGPYGEYSLVYVVVSIVTAIIAGWLQQSVLRYLPRYREEGRLEEFLAKLGTILWLTAILILLVGLGAHRWVEPILGGYGRYYVPAVVWVIAWLVFFVQNHAFRANLQSATFARYEVLYAVGRLAFALALVYFVSKDVIALIIG